MRLADVMCRGPILLAAGDAGGEQDRAISWSILVAHRGYDDRFGNFLNGQVGLSRSRSSKTGPKPLCFVLVLHRETPYWAFQPIL